MNHQRQMMQFRTNFHLHYNETTEELSALKIDDRDKSISSFLANIPVSLEPNDLTSLSRSFGIFAACLNEYFIGKSNIRELSRAINTMNMGLRLYKKLSPEVSQRCYIVIQHGEFLKTKDSMLPKTATLQIKEIAKTLLEKINLEYEEKTLLMRSIEQLWDFDRIFSIRLIRKILSNVDLDIILPDWIAIALEYLADSEHRNEALILAEKIYHKIPVASQYARDDLENFIFKMNYTDSDIHPMIRARYGHKSIRAPRTAIAMLEHHLYRQSRNDQKYLKPKLSIESIRKQLRGDCGYWQKTSSIYRFVNETDSLLRYWIPPSLLTRRIAKLELIMSQTNKHSNKIVMQKIIEKIWSKYHPKSSQLEKNYQSKKPVEKLIAKHRESF